MTLRARLAPPQHAEFLLPTGNAISAVCFVLKNSNTGDPAGQENVDLCRALRQGRGASHQHIRSKHNDDLI
jgi:hypothetical protein